MSAIEAPIEPPSAGLVDAAAAVIEARAAPRVAVDFPVEIYSTDFEGPLAAHARDLSVGGVCVATRSMFALRSVHRVALELPDRSLPFDATGRWQADSSSEDSFLSGIAFRAPEESNVSRLWDLVHAAGKTLGLFLYSTSELSELGADDATNIAQISRLRRVASGRSIYPQDACRPGDDSIFVVRSGRVNLRYRFGPGDEISLLELDPGSVFGGLPITAGTPNLESALAATDTTLVDISRASFTYLRVAKPLLAQRLVQIVARTHIRRVRQLLALAARRR